MTLIFIANLISHYLIDIFNNHSKLAELLGLKKIFRKVIQFTIRKKDEYAIEKFSKFTFTLN